VDIAFLFASQQRFLRIVLQPQLSLENVGCETKTRLRKAAWGPRDSFVLLGCASEYLTAINHVNNKTSSPFHGSGRIRQVGIAWPWAHHVLFLDGLGLKQTFWCLWELQLLKWFYECWFRVKQSPFSALLQLLSALVQLLPRCFQRGRFILGLKDQHCAGEDSHRSPSEHNFKTRNGRHGGVGERTAQWDKKP